MPGGRCPPDLEAAFLEDVRAGLSNGQLAGKYGRVKRTIRSWKTKLRREGKLDDEPQKSSREKVAFREIENYAEASCTSERIRTLDGLLEACAVDLDIWRVKDWGVKKWEVGAKLKYGDLQWAGGKASGWQQHKGLGVQDLWSVWAKFIRREPIAVHPVIRPVECAATYQKPHASKRTGVRRALLGGDTQFGFRRDVVTGRLQPFHDRRALDLFLQIAALEQPDVIVWGGDIKDFAEMQDRFLKDPEFESTTQPAIEEAHWWLAQLRAACPDAEIIIMAGNHDDRLRKAIITHFKAAHQLRAADEIELPPPLSPERLLGLQGLGIDWIGDYPDGEYWLDDGLRTIHGSQISQTPGGTANAILKDADDWTVFFHAHRREMASKTIHSRQGRRFISVFSPGCLCRVDGSVPGKKKRQNWQQGVALMDYAGGHPSAYLIEIRDGTAVWDRRVFQARDRVADLRKDNPRWKW
jgi:transposase